MNIIFVCMISIVMISLISADVIRFECDYWAPYNGDPKSLYPGFQYEIAKIIFEKAGHKVVYNVMPFSRALQRLESGDADATFGLLKEEAQKNKLLIPSQNIGFSSYSFFVLHDNKWRYNGIKSLESQMLGVIQDYDYNELNHYINTNKNSIKVQVMAGDSSLEKNINKLINNRITVIVDDEYVVAWTLKSMKHSGKLIKAGSLTQLKPVYIAFSSKNPKSQEYIQILNKGVLELKRTGEYQKILSKYGINE